MPRGKQQSSDAKGASKPKENTVNGEELTMSQLHEMINDLASKMFEKKKKELKEEIEAEMEDEIQYRLLNQFGELEEMIDNVKEETEKSVNKVKSQIEKCNKDIQNQRGLTSNEASSLRQELQSAVKGLEKVTAESQKLKRRIEKVEFITSGKIKTEIKTLEAKFDEFEQQQYNQNVQIVGLQETDEPDIDSDRDRIVKIATETLGISLKKTDIEETYRMGKRREGKRRDIIVKFKKKPIRDKFHENRKMSATHDDPKDNVYINDHLTKHRQHLLYVARKLYKAKKIQAAWTQGGNVLIRKVENGPVTPITKHEDLEEFRNEDEVSNITDLNSDTDISDSD